MNTIPIIRQFEAYEIETQTRLENKLQLPSDFEMELYDDPYGIVDLRFQLPTREFLFVFLR